MNVEELLDVLDAKIEESEKRANILREISPEISFMAQGESTAYWVVKNIIEVNGIN